MFKGTTVIEMNTATMIEAIQEYLEDRVDSDRARTFAVTGVIGGGGSDATFRITVEETKKPTGA